MTKLALGLMSGTSCDGVSLALCRFENKTFKILSHATYPYSTKLAHSLLHALELKTPELSRLNASVGLFFADCAVRFLKSSRVPFSRVAVIGSHGQTVYHGPKDKPRNTLQIGEPSYLAEKTGIPVVADFRPRDIAAGGEGAPLIPFFDLTFFARGRAVALQNIGGIGNVTFMAKNGKMLAFDTGPGNCLIDLAVRQMTRDRQAYDRDGRIARRGAVHLRPVNEMLRHPYFRLRPPKSTGRELFNAVFIRSYLRGLSPEDTAATLTFFTAASIHQSYQRFLPGVSEIFISGGGAKNPVLMRTLQKLFQKIPVRSLEAVGVPAQAKEPAAFAFFAWQAIQKKINHAPRGTGAKHACILGKIIP